MKTPAIGRQCTGTRELTSSCRGQALNLSRSHFCVTFRTGKPRIEPRFVFHGLNYIYDTKKNIYIKKLTHCICIYLRCIPILAQMCPILGAKRNTSFWLNPESFSSRCQNGRRFQVVDRPNFRRLAIIYIIYMIYIIYIIYIYMHNICVYHLWFTILTILNFLLSPISR